MVRRLAAFLLLWVVALTLLPTSTTAEGEPSVEGNCEIVLEGVPTRHIQFTARTAPNGATTGEVTFRDTSPTSGAEANADSSDAFYLKAHVDCLVVKDNKALLTSIVTEASAERYVGGRLIVVAVANRIDGNSLSAGKITWGFYRKETRDWLATDFDRPADEVNPAAWMARDSERDDDEGKVTTSNNDAVITCGSFPLSSFTFKDEYYVTGAVTVRP